METSTENNFIISLTWYNSEQSFITNLWQVLLFLFLFLQNKPIPPGLLPSSQHSVCALRAVCKYLKIHQGTSPFPLYIFILGQYLTRAKVTAILHVLLPRLDIPTERYTSHSFWIGAATTAAEDGLPPWLIQTLRKWSSDCFTLYICTPPSVLQRVPNLQASVSTPFWTEELESKPRPLHSYMKLHLPVIFSQGWQYLGCILGAHLTPTLQYIACSRLGGTPFPPPPSQLWLLCALVRFRCRLEGLLCFAFRSYMYHSIDCLSCSFKSFFSSCEHLCNLVAFLLITT